VHAYGKQEAKSVLI